MGNDQFQRPRDALDETADRLRAALDRDILFLEETLAKRRANNSPHVADLERYIAYLKAPQENKPMDYKSARALGRALVKALVISDPLQEAH